jgi:hypothetical protein
MKKRKRRKPDRRYHTDNASHPLVQITKEWSMKFGRFLYSVSDVIDGKRLSKGTSFAEARSFVRNLSRGKKMIATR